MTAGETLLKISDYPFAYSFITILLVSLGYGFVNNHYLFLTAAGFFGTSLVIIDPVGKFVIRGLKKNLRKTFPSNLSKQQEQLLQYHLSAIDIKSIRTEVDRIVSFLYFISLMLFFILAIGLSQSFVDILVITNQTDQIICDSNCIRILGIIFPTILASFLIHEARKMKKELIERTTMAGFYRFNLDLKSPTKASKDSFGRAIEQGDWGLAKWWQTQIAKETTSQEGFQEQRTKLRTEQIIKQLEVYGTLSTLLSVAGNWQNVHGISNMKNNTHILGTPDEENRFGDIFEKSKYLISEKVTEMYSEYHKTKSYEQGKFPGTNTSRSYVIVNLTNMEKQVNDEYKQLLKQYNKITGSEFDQEYFDSNLFG
ncbi:hypothetical protein [Nitrosarchaeum sp. AC2]|uniref:hypothetical protein n=1 Tax=Nitrosarchaeum sp. AC2 TaxID=2259673 RepID=UPI0015C85C8E|nr:hypothetical protein [Nitrosarchaeum sp. AC2]QLH11478.1 hypothetical protein DSQ20_08530 [Nitrosarchaeum sp. AC2]